MSPETAAKLEALRKHLEHARAVLAIRKGESPDIDESAAPAIEQAAAALADPAVFATALVEWTARKIRERYPDIAAAADIWKNPVAVKTVRETADMLEAIGLDRAKAKEVMENGRKTARDMKANPNVQGEIANAVNSSAFFEAAYRRAKGRHVSQLANRSAGQAQRGNRLGQRRRKRQERRYGLNQRHVR